MNEMHSECKFEERKHTKIYEREWTKKVRFLRIHSFNLITILFLPNQCYAENVGLHTVSHVCIQQ